MCDLLAITSERPFHAPNLLPGFAHQTTRNAHGWGLGWFDETGAALVEKSARPAVSGQTIDPDFQRLANEVTSSTILAHVRFTSSGATCDANCHPFRMRFLGRDWLFAHNGTCREIESYQTAGNRIDEATNDSARIFEFLRDRISAGWRDSPERPVRLLPLVVDATTALLDEYPSGRFNFNLACDRLLFSFVHFRPSWFVRRVKDVMDTWILTTADGGGLTDGEEWTCVGDRDESYGSLLTISGSVLLECRDVARGM